MENKLDVVRLNKIIDFAQMVCYNLDTIKERGNKKMEIIKEIMKDDYVKVGKHKFKFGTIPYWFVRLMQGALCAVWCYVVYIGMWLILGGI